MSIFGSILKTGFDILTLPIDVVKDVATLGGTITDKKEPYTLSKFKELDNDVKDISEDLKDL